MRIWHIEPAYLDYKRQVSLHREVHIFHTVATNGKTWGRYPACINYSLDYVKMVHDATVAAICVRDPMRHAHSPEKLIQLHPTPFELPPDYEIYSYTPTTQDIENDITQLRTKWEAEGYYFGVGTIDLCQLESKYGLPVGIDMFEAVGAEARTHNLIKTYQHWFNTYRQLFPRSRLQDRLQVFLYGLYHAAYLVPDCCNDYEIIRQKLGSDDPQLILPYIQAEMELLAEDKRIPGKYDPTKIKPYSMPPTPRRRITIETPGIEIAGYQRLLDQWVHFNETPVRRIPPAPPRRPRRPKFIRR
jgi:hypothetical protein